MIWAYFVCPNTTRKYEEEKRKKILNMFCSSLVFQSRICPVLGFRWHMIKSHNLSLSQGWFQYCALCGLSTEFSGNSKWGLYCCREIWAFRFFPGSHVKISFRLVSLRIKWNGKEMEKKWKYFSKNTTIVFKVYSYLYLSVNRSRHITSSELYWDYFIWCLVSVFKIIKKKNLFQLWLIFQDLSE